MRVANRRISLGLPPSLHHLRGQAISDPALFGSFLGTTQQSDFSAPWLIGVRPWASRCALHSMLQKTLRPPGSRASRSKVFSDPGAGLGSCSHCRIKPRPERSRRQRQEQSLPLRFLSHPSAMPAESGKAVATQNACAGSTAPVDRCEHRALAQAIDCSSLPQEQASRHGPGDAPSGRPPETAYLLRHIALNPLPTPVHKPDSARFRARREPQRHPSLLPRR